MRIKNLLRNSVACILMVALFLPLNAVSAKTDAGQKQWNAIAKELKKNPHQPSPWYKLALLADKMKAYGSALDAALIAVRLLPYQSTKRRGSRDRLYESQLTLLIQRLANSEAKAILDRRSGGHLVVDTRSSITAMSIQDLERLLLSSKSIAGAKSLKKSSIRKSIVPLPAIETDDYEMLLTARLGLYRQHRAEYAIQVIQSELEDLVRDKEAYKLALGFGEQDPLVLLDFLRKEVRNRFRSQGKRELARIGAQQAMRTSKLDGNTRRALYELLLLRSQMADQSSDFDVFDRIAAEQGIDYLRDILFTKTDLVLDATELMKSESMWILGDLDTYGHYASVAKTGEIVIQKDGWVRGFVTHSRLTQRPEIKTRAANYVKREIWGKALDFKREKGLTWQDIFTSVPPSRLPDRYSPCSLVKSSSDVSGGILGGIADFIEEHPVASALIAGTAAYLMTRENESPSVSSTRASAPTRDQPRVGDWSKWHPHPLDGGRHRETNVYCPGKLIIEVEEYYSKSGRHWYQRDAGAVLLPKKFDSLWEFISVECSTGSGMIDRDRRIQNN